jgi:LmbE family N-acetylglucosaminyl deacetylase
MRIAIITAHPHYFALYCGGTILKHSRRGDDVFVVSLSSGEAMTDKVRQEELIRINLKEMEAAGKLLSVRECRILDFQDSRIGCNDDVKMAINNNIRELKPDIILTHWRENTHPDFTNTARSTIDACMWALLVQGPWAARYPCHWVSRMFAFEHPFLSINFDPDFFVDISDVLETKIEAVKCFKIHIDVNDAGLIERKVSAIVGPNRRWGLASGVMHAEAFRQVKIHERHLKAFDYLPG